MAFWLFPLLAYAPWTTSYSHVWVIKNWQEIMPQILWIPTGIALATLAIHVGLAAFGIRPFNRFLGLVWWATAIGLVFVNQEREKIGALPFQEQTYSPGGRALRHYASVRIKMAYTGQIRKGDVVVGVKLRAKANKNKLGPPRREANFEFYFEPPTLRAAEKET